MAEIFIVIRGYFIGLCQVLRSSAYPPLLATSLAVEVLEDARAVARMYRRHAQLLHRLALAEGDDSEVLAVIDAEINDPKLRGEFVAGVALEDFFCARVWDRCGLAAVPLWAAVLVMIAVTVDQWECVLLGVDPPPVDRLPGFHPEQEVA